ncbi:MarR family winged helix-turn-helix transcriptional regulator [Smaragdicoccus niigatensis]|uniref:MarR family winged helix-turn-helix transcriptional regulator n=1 Tax=Smaragdicoccus niigatensis TaxID=359359 RepID=UPI000365E53E|nr:MarR family transcriptional regulator [Smaragdicoccus niigatensis]
MSEESLPELFWSVARRLRAASLSTLEPFGLAPSHARALSVIVRRGPIRPSALSERLHVSPRAATDVLDALQEHGLIEREADPGDRRATIVRLTAEGERVGQAIHDARAAESERAFGALSAQDREQLRRILSVLAADE